MEDTKCEHKGTNWVTCAVARALSRSKPLIQHDRFYFIFLHFPACLWVFVCLLCVCVRCVIYVFECLCVCVCVCCIYVCVYMCWECVCTMNFCSGCPVTNTTFSLFLPYLILSSSACITMSFLSSTIFIFISHSCSN